VRALQAVEVGTEGDARADRGHCPGQKPAFLVFKRPARPYKSPIQNRFT
jgi:hypothetical protein